MTQADLLAALPEGRLPASLMQLGGLDLLALFGAGLIAAALLSLLVAPFVARPPSRRTLIRATRGLPAEERVLAIARILGHLPAPLHPTAYGVPPALPDDEIERLALKAKAAPR